MANIILFKNIRGFTNFFLKVIFSQKSAVIVFKYYPDKDFIDYVLSKD